MYYYMYTITNTYTITIFLEYVLVVILKLQKDFSIKDLKSLLFKYLNVS